MFKSSGKWIAALIAATLSVVGLGIFLALRPSSESRSTPSSTPIADATPKAISALGRLEPEGEVIQVAAPATLGTARVSRLVVHEGEQVQQGQVIAVMDGSDRLLAEVMQAEAQVQEAQTRLVQVQAGARQGDIEAQIADVNRLTAELQNAEQEYKRYQTLYQNGAISASDLDARHLRVETTARSLEQARKRLHSIAEVRPTDVQQAQATINVAVANLQRAKAELENSAVRSPITGQVLKVHARPGEQVGTDGIVEVGRTEQMYAVAEIYETDITRVRRGQRARITSSAFTEELSGTVAHVGLQIRKNDVLNTDPAADTDARVVEVKIRLDDSEAAAGLTNLQVKVEILP